MPLSITGDSLYDILAAPALHSFPLSLRCQILIKANDSVTSDTLVGWLASRTPSSACTIRTSNDTHRYSCQPTVCGWRGVRARIPSGISSLLEGRTRGGRVSEVLQLKAGFRRT